METLFAITRQPLFWLAVGLLAGCFITRSPTNRSDRARTRYANWIKRHYPAVILTLVAILAVVALTFYLVEIGLSVSVLVDRLREAAKDPWTGTSELQSLASAVAILVGVLAAAATILYSSIRVWINERTATATEEGLITDRINKAVQGLGAEKVVNRLGRTVRYTVDGVDGSYFEWIDDRQTPPDNPDMVDGKVKLTNDPWSSFPDTQPNLEVRIGSIYALERIAQDSDRDHVQVMEILCAYIRQNAPDTLAEPFPEDWCKAFEAEEIDQKCTPFPSEIQHWARNLKKPREDIQVALTVLGRRTARQIALEGYKDEKGKWHGYRMDLRSTCLQNAFMSEGHFQNARFNHADLQGANLTGARMQGAYLSDAQLQGAQLWEAQMQGANLFTAQMQSAVLSKAQMQGADLCGAKMQGTDLRRTEMQRANLRGAQMQGTDLFTAQMQGVSLIRAQMDASTTLSAADLRGAAVRDVDYSDVPISQEQVDSLFGDQTVILPEGLTRPDWPEIDEGGITTFRDKWRAWQKSIGFDPEDASTW